MELTSLAGLIGLSPKWCDSIHTSQRYWQGYTFHIKGLRRASRKPYRKEPNASGACHEPLRVHDTASGRHLTILQIPNGRTCV